jgi:hypothetical protein
MKQKDCSKHVTEMTERGRTDARDYAEDKGFGLGQLG